MMSPETFALLQRLHGHAALLGLAVAAHPLITLWTRRQLTRWTHRTAWMGAVLTAIPAAGGWALYPTYRNRIKLRLMSSGGDAWLWFETKEHLAAFCVALLVGGAATLTLAGATPEGRRAAWWLILMGWLCGAAAGALGVAVAGMAHPAWLVR